MRPSCLVLGLVLVLLAPAATASSAARTDGIQSLESIRAAALALAREEAIAIAGDDVKVRGGRMDSRLRLKHCDGELEAFRPPGGRAVGAGTVGVRCIGAAGWTVYVPVWVSVRAAVVVVQRPVARGATLTAADLRVEQRDLERLRGGYLTETAAAVGMRAVRSLSVGTVVRPTAIKRPTLVSRGRSVTLLLRTAGLELRATGKALADGALGDIVAVRNTQSNRRVEGVVSGPGQVSVRR